MSALTWALALAGVGVILALMLRSRGKGSLDARQVRELTEGADGVVILDVRSDGEYRGGHLAGARHIPVGLVSQRAKKLDKDATYVVYCQSGMRSAKATAALQRAGFPRVHNMRGGISSWQAAGFPVTRK